ncbi:potassium transporter 5-like [Telopea speciosissima]|uniref:potassium transporter 5-like n=1 Tax=Telopea speciosissima TaxID=54955 RepID=UPI001CC76E8C|nr:potassium transporter 5-like [Telopea speciosissima]
MSRKVSDDAVVEVEDSSSSSSDGRRSSQDEEVVNKELQEKKLSWEHLRRHDSLYAESGKFRGRDAHHHSKVMDRAMILQLAFQSIGIVYGDIGTSPLYVYSSTFTDGIKNNDDILGVLSIIFYTLTLLPLIKYVFIVLQANDNGDGGTFALYSLICRYAKVGLIPSQQAEDKEVSNFRLELPNNSLRRASTVKAKLEKSKSAKYFLLFATMLGTSMVIGDGILTPSISVLSAVGGITEATDKVTQGAIVGMSVGILICLFLCQRFGTDKVGYSFAPIICIWFAFIGSIGLYNFIKYDPSVIKALNPKYIINYFQRNKKQAWISLGGIVLATTGTEALFADVGHFSVRSIQISMCSVTFPSLILAYTGQASYLRKHNAEVSNAFYKSVPGSLFWPMLVIAILASIIASQAMISGTFSIIQQSLSLGCFPRVKIVHTSAKYEGQVYIPEINYLLMVASVAVTLGFRTTNKIGNAYGIAVVFVMTLTSAFLVLIMIMIWKTNILLVIVYVLVIGSVELLYLSSVLYKFDQGGYLPLAFAVILMTVMFVWNYVHRKKYYYELDHKVSPQKLKEIASNPKLNRVPGLAIFYSELVQGIPPIFNHYIANVPALHSVLVFVSIKSLPMSKVPVEERFLFRRVEPRELNVFRCVVRYGYTDIRNENEPFERILVDRLKEYIREVLWMSGVNNKGSATKGSIETTNSGSVDEGGRSNADEDNKGEVLEFELKEVDRGWQAGIVHLMGESEVMAGKDSSFGKKVLINYAYNILRRNLRQSYKVFDIPPTRLLKVGMTYEL